MGEVCRHRERSLDRVAIQSLDLTRSPLLSSGGLDCFVGPRALLAMTVFLMFVKVVFHDT